MTFKRLQKLDDYYKLLGCEKNYLVEEVPCEVCNSRKFTVVSSHTDTGNNILAPVPVKACNKCGFLMQNPRFPDEFYKRYYDEFYPYMRSKSSSNSKGDPNNVTGKRIVCEDGSPSEFGFELTIKRGKYLYDYLQKFKIFIPLKKMLDVGCGSGGFLYYFAKKGFEVLGNDPDNKAADFGINKKLRIDKINGESMNYKEKFGLIIIIGSLEHCLDPNKVLSKCWEMLVDNGLIILEGRYFPISESFRWLNSNHHRFLTHNSSQAILIKHGFEIIKSTTDPVCGENTGRSGGGFVFARKKENSYRYLNLEDLNDRKKFLDKLVQKKLIKYPKDIIKFVQEHDKKFKINFVDI